MSSFAHRKLVEEGQNLEEDGDLAHVCTLAPY
jgi:hypothetical protein